MKVFAILALAIACTYAQIPWGIAVMRGTNLDPTITGTVIFTQNADNTSLIDVRVSLSGITQNLNVNHGLHVHFWGDISDSNLAMSAGPHWSLPGEAHGCPPSETRHSGDMGNWMVNADGTLSMNKTLDKLTLTGVNSIIGRGVILHNLTDDCTTNNNGNAGQRIAMGVIGIMNTTGNTNTANNGLVRTTNGQDVAICNLAALTPSTIQGYGQVTQGATGGVIVIVQINGVVNQTVHPAHIHQYGDIRTAASVGGHWNPTTQRHGMYGYPQHHAGDLGNIVYFQSNVTVAAGNFSQSNNSFNVLGGTYNILGLSLVIHAMRDNCADPVGNSGARVATCVWGISNASLSVFNPPQPTSVSTDYDAQTIADCNASFGINQTATTTQSAATTTQSAATTTQSAATTTQSATTTGAAATTTNAAASSTESAATTTNAAATSTNAAATSTNAAATSTNAAASATGVTTNSATMVALSTMTVLAALLF